jgi:hypothetical protein
LNPFATLNAIRVKTAVAEIKARGLTKVDCTDPETGKLHAPQWEFATTDERDCLVLVGRQGGKTGGARLRAAKMATSKARSRTLYVAYDLALGRDEFFEPLCELLTEWGWKYQSDATKLRIKLENGSVIQCKSADDMRSAGRLRGRNWDLIIVDEAQELAPDVLKKLIVDVIGPMLLRRKGALAILFTPPDVQAGWLWEEFKSGRWKLFQWAQADNPWLPPGETALWLTKRGMTIDHPIARREILGLWEPNAEKQVYEFDYRVNIYDPGPVKTDEPAILPVGPDFPPESWSYGIGGDIGWRHPSSVTMVAWNRKDIRKRLYEILTQGAPEWTVDKWFEVLMSLRLHIKKRPFRSVVIDQAGSGGLNVVHSLEERFRGMGLPIELTYKPASVTASVGLTNDEFRTGRLLLRKDSPLLEEIPQTIWKSNSNRQEIDKAKFDPHGLDGLRYAVWGATNYKNKGKIKVEKTAEQLRAEYLDGKDAQREKYAEEW